MTSNRLSYSSTINNKNSVMSFSYLKKTGNIRHQSDVCVSTLDSSTIRWIKNRRSLDNAHHRVVVSETRISKLRELFDSLDIDRRGFITIQDIISVEKYSKDLTKNINETTINLIEFIMDLFSKTYKSEAKSSNALSAIDYQLIEIKFKDFMITMTGNSRSIIEKSNEDEFEKLRHCFSEYANEKRRQNSEHLIMNRNQASDSTNKIYSNFLTLLDSSPTFDVHGGGKGPRNIGNSNFSSSQRSKSASCDEEEPVTKASKEFDEIESRLETLFVTLDPVQFNQIVSNERNYFNRMNDLNSTLNSINSKNSTIHSSNMTDISNPTITLSTPTLSYTKKSKHRTWVPTKDFTVAKSSVKTHQKAIVDARSCHIGKEKFAVTK